MELYKVMEKDNVAVAFRPLEKGKSISFDLQTLTAVDDIPWGHKIALQEIKKGQEVIKYNFPIGTATIDIKAGQWVHTHNLKTGLGELLNYSYNPQLKTVKIKSNEQTFMGYRRKDGRVGTRNEIWIIPTVSCVNRNAELIAKKALETMPKNSGVEGIYEFKHPYGCSQMGEDFSLTQKILAGLVNHPNAGGVLVLGLGCENNHIAEFQKVLGKYDADRVRFMVAQDVEDEIATGVELVNQLVEHARQFQRQPCSVSDLTVGLKCGGSDAFSGITANPLVGAFSDLLLDQGGSTVLTEVPEMFGAETLLMNRTVNRKVFEKTVKLINGFKEYYLAHNQPVYENPSPGNKQGGISTLEEKSLGCTQKGGTGNIVDVLDYGDSVKVRGLNLLSSPGNDMVAATALLVAGCQVILFTTGRGTPLGTAVPTIKIATNSDLYRRKSNWMDFNAGTLIAGNAMPKLAEELWEHVIEVASGRETKAEVMGFREIAIFKTGVTL